MIVSKPSSSTAGCVMNETSVGVVSTIKSAVLENMDSAYGEPFVLSVLITVADKAYYDGNEKYLEE